MVDERQLALEEARKWLEEHPDEFRDGIERAKRDLEFALDHMEEWRRKHPNTWAAVSDGKLVGMNSDHEALLDNLSASGIDPLDAYVFFLHDERTTLAL